MEDSNLNSNKPSGIGGWLLVFILLSVFSVLRDLSGLDAVLQVAREYPDIKYVVYAFLFLPVIFILFFIYCLALIIIKHAHAIRMIKIFFITRPIVVALIPIIPLIVIWITDENFIIDREILKITFDVEFFAMLLGTCFWSLIWYAYFNESKRVKNTWGDQASSHQALIS